MGIFLPIVCFVLLAAIGHAACVRLAKSTSSVLIFFAGQVWILFGVTLAALAVLVVAWLEGRWWLRLPISTAAAVGLAGLVWLGLSEAAWVRRPEPDAEVPEGKGRTVWLMVSLVLASALFVAMDSALFVVGAQIPPPTASGQITKELSYEVDSTTYGFGAHGFEYSIYRTPKWFGVVHREVAHALFQSTCPLDAELPSEFEAGSVRFAAGPNDRAVLLTCTNNRPTGPASFTTEVPLR